MGKKRIHYKRTCQFCGNVQQSRGMAYFTCVACDKTNWLRDDLKPVEKTTLQPSAETPKTESMPETTETPEALTEEIPPDDGDELTLEDLQGKPSEVESYVCGDCSEVFSGKPDNCPHCGGVLDW